MTIEELAEETGRAVNTIRNFKRFKNALEKKGIIVDRIGRNNYTIKYLENAEKIINTKKLMNYKFGKLQPLYPTEKRNGSKIVWKCKCDCGNYCEVIVSSLMSGQTRSCGCLTSAKDLTNKKFGRLVALYPTEERDCKGSIIWECKCECGNHCKVASCNLVSGNTQSCGCLNISHGELKIRELLNNANIQYITEYKPFKFQDTNKFARFDFFINNKYIIEFDGIQHFKTSGWNTKEQLELIKKHDKIKNDWCKINNIPLIRIPYTHLKDLCFLDLQLETTKWRVV